MTVFKHGDPVRMRAHTLTPHTTGTVTGTTPEGRVLVRWDDNHAITEQVPHYLEPLGEPMSKTFKSAVTPATHRLTIGTINDKQVLLESESPHIVQAARIAIATAEAPALAFAILEAAGFEADSEDASSLVNNAMGQLAMHVATEATKAKEAADREALEGEALALLNAMYGKGRENWNGMSEAKAHWITVAKVARELYGVKA